MLISPQKLDMPDADVILHKHLFSQEQCNYFFTSLYKEIEWEQNSIKIFGKTLPEPRLSAYYGDKAYRYSGITREPLPWHPVLLEIKSAIKPIVGIEFNAVFLNLYRNGFDGVGWHSDNQKELGLNPTIASVSFGETRRFIFRRKDNRKNQVSLELSDGDLLIMGETTQKFWQHQVPKSSPKTASQVQPRINLTYRLVI
ncbi:MAG: alpha-ketoglutarate-dependent dioxygenase AlkB family protein [Waterburya sp.]